MEWGASLSEKVLFIIFLLIGSLGVIGYVIQIIGSLGAIIFTKPENRPYWYKGFGFPFTKEMKNMLEKAEHQIFNAVFGSIMLLGFWFALAYWIEYFIG